MAYCKKPSAVYRNRMQRYPDDIWLIWSNKNSCWYRSKSQGYTVDVLQAGLFTREEAAKHMSDGPKKYRVTEPFPAQSVIASVRLRAEQLEAEAAAAQSMLDTLLDGRLERDDGR